MIHAISLGGFVKKSFPSKTVQTNQDSLQNNLPLDPKVSGMDIVILQAKDVSGFKGETLLNAIKTANPAISVIFIYTKDQELDCLKGVKLQSKKIAKVTADAIQKAVESVIENMDVRKPEETYIPSKDNQVVDIPKEVPQKRAEITEPPDNELKFEPAEIPEPAEDLEKKNSGIAPLQPQSLEERVKNLGAFGDFDLFKHAMRRESVIKDILSDSSRYAGAMQMLDVLDREIANVFTSVDKTAEEKMDAIKEIAMRRVAFKEDVNNILVDRFSNIMLAILASTEATLDRRLREAKEALNSVAMSKILYSDSETLNVLIKERLEMQVTLHELQTQVISLYQQMDKAVVDLIESFDEGLPSENAFINEHFKMLKPMFNPENATALSQKLLQDLSTGRVKLSMFENQILEIVKLVFALCEKDSSIIEYQQHLITLLKSNRVEDAVIVNTVLKSCMRLYIGPSEVGTRATAITWAGLLSRRQNSILLDLSGKAKFEDYGVTPVKLEDFLNERIQEPFLCVEGQIDAGDVGEERIMDIITELKLRLNYYPYINVILDPAQKLAIKLFAEEALTVHFLCDSSPRSVAIMKNTIEGFETPNIAKKLVLIAPAVDPLRLCNTMGVDTMTTRVISLPYLQRMRAMAFNKLAPHKDKEISEVFEEAFR